MNILESFEKYQTIIPDFQEFKSSILGKSPTVIRANELKNSSSHLEEILKSHDIKFVKNNSIHGVYEIEHDKPIGDYLFHHLGYYYVQHLSSLLAPLAIEVSEKDRVLDLCAAPGGKTCFLAQFMNNKGIIVANELNRNRMRALKGNLSRLGVANTITVNHRAELFPETYKFNKILLDGPCSAEGTYRGKDRLEILWKNDEGFKKSLYIVQRKIILKAFDLLEERGDLVYSTCTYNPDENEACVQYLLDHREGVQIENLNLPIEVSPGLIEWEGRDFHPDLIKAGRVYPHKFNSGGFFLVKISKTSK